MRATTRSASFTGEKNREHQGSDHDAIAAGRDVRPVRPHTRPPRRLPPWWRNLLLTTHVVVVVGVLGTDLVLLTPAVTGLARGDPELIRAGYLVIGLLAEAVLVPLALAALATGILLGLGTPWV